MSRLWQSFLVAIRIIGNNSGCHQRADRSFFYCIDKHSCIIKNAPIGAHCGGLEGCRYYDQPQGENLANEMICCKAKQFPVCARCTGVFVGQTIALLGVIFKKPVKSFKLPIFLLSIMGIDWGIQEIGLKESTNIRRFVTGIAGGFGVFGIYIRMFTIIKKKLLKEVK